MFQALCFRYRDRMLHDEQCSAIVAMMIGNAHRGKDTRPFEMGDFIWSDKPHLAARAEQQPRQRMTGDEMSAICHRARAAYKAS
jgi:hypothetical protein